MSTNFKQTDLVFEFSNDPMHRILASRLMPGVHHRASWFAQLYSQEFCTARNVAAPWESYTRLGLDANMKGQSMVESWWL